MAKIYLAGPITGLSYDEARLGWRVKFQELVKGAEHIKCYSPMRGKDTLKGVKEISGDPEMYPKDTLTTAQAIIARDRADVQACDLMVANFLGATKTSIGTCVEFGWADAYRKQVIIVIEDENNPHLHAFLTQIAGFRVKTIEEAAEVAKILLTPGV